MNFVKRITIFTFIFLLCLPPMGVFAAKASPLDYSDVMDDLQGLKLGGVAFDESNYPIQDGAEPELLGIYEYGWQTDLYSLYFYIYNPDVENVDRDYYSYVNINYFVFKDSLDSQPVSFWRLNVEPISQSDDGRFLKFKVDGSSFASILSAATSRIYSAEIEMRYYDHLNQDPYSGNDESVMLLVSSRGETFTYNHNGAIIYQSGETIALNVNPSMYKTDFHPTKGDHWHQMIYTAYFTIPKEYVEEFDALVGIEATWEEYETAPLVVTEDDTLFSILKEMASNEALEDKTVYGYVNRDYGAIVSEYWVDSYNGTPIAAVGRTSINALSRNNILRDDLFFVDTFFSGYTLDSKIDRSFMRFDTALKVSDIDDFYIPAIGKYYDTDGDGLGDCPASFGLPLISGHGGNVHSFTADDILSVDKRFDDNWINNFFVGLWYPDSKDVEATLDPLYYLKDSDMTGYSRTKVNENLFIGEEFWADFYDDYSKAKLSGDQVVLFRFALRDYYSAPARYMDGDTYSCYDDTANCALSYGSAFLDFDIIKLSFSKDSEIYEFDVDADPIDFVPGGYSPNTPGLGAAADNIWEKLEELFQRIAKLIGGVVVVIVVVIVFKWLLDWLARRRR